MVVGGRGLRVTTFYDDLVLVAASAPCVCPPSAGLIGIYSNTPDQNVLLMRHSTHLAITTTTITTIIITISPMHGKGLPHRSPPPPSISFYLSLVENTRLMMCHYPLRIGKCLSSFCFCSPGQHLIKNSSHTVSLTQPLPVIPGLNIYYSDRILFIWLTM